MNPILAIGPWLFYLIYFSIAFCVTIVGYVNEVTGRRRENHGSLTHRFFWQLHSGLHVNPMRSYGDEGRLKRTGGGNARATPEGRIVYFSKLKRRGRAIRNNIAVVVFLTLAWAFLADPPDTLRTLTLLAVGFLAWRLVARVRRAREANPLAVAEPDEKAPLSRSKAARLILDQDRPVPGSVATTATPMSIRATPARPRLTTGVAPSVIATLLAQQLGVSPAEVQGLLKMAPEQGELVLPDTYAALVRQRGDVEELIEAHTDGDVSFSWRTTTTPRRLIWTPKVKALGLPAMARFRDYLDQIEELPNGVFGLGLDENRDLYCSDYRGDTPWHCSSMGSGTGKSSRFLALGAQICHNDPQADLYCVDTKQVSFQYLKGIPGVHVFDNPQSEMGAIWKVFFTLEGIMRGRYTAVREGQARYEDFNDIWLLVDEGNDLASALKSWWKKIREKDEPAQPVIWEDAIAPLLRLGRQCGIRGEFMLQDVTDRALGGASLKMAFSEFTMAGWKEPQFKRILGYAPPPIMEGPGKMLACRGNKQTWVQGFFDNPEWLRDYALEARRGRVAA